MSIICLPRTKRGGSCPYEFSRSMPSGEPGCEVPYRPCRRAVLSSSESEWPHPPGGLHRTAASLSRPWTDQTHALAPGRDNHLDGHSRGMSWRPMPPPSCWRSSDPRSGSGHRRPEVDVKIHSYLPHV
ncbi:hypothetical protein MAPG_02468 [Magnaporthiopsis poae ATCC 64411]|uniref:Uncharacterized protein n=1 Tax=Magnaporthiopsis poae (strain ATCC 64411 / 73-15) TaxID=644358 RepID=A0A0C4DRG0_MAGP6|nr:hypothetical protein MAPG_02468 [Magnaporthiopsis poae ATCC 64411]